MRRTSFPAEKSWAGPAVSIKWCICAVTDQAMTPGRTGRRHSHARHHKGYKPSPGIREDSLASYERDGFLYSMSYARTYPEQLPLLDDLLPTIQTPVRIVFILEALRTAGREAGTCGTSSVPASTAGARRPMSGQSGRSRRPPRCPDIGRAPRIGRHIRSPQDHYRTPRGRRARRPHPHRACCGP